MASQIFPLGFQWPVVEPFLFCVHHLDHYPQGDGSLGVAPHHSKGRQMGQDFELKDGFRMYHGEPVPGFPVHPHRGFETVTIVRRGFVDHADSLGAAGRYGEGDVQWMTAGRGVQHTEMFPVLREDSINTVELFQIWLNLPAASKMVPPAFSMFWSEKIPLVKLDGGKVSISVIAGEVAGAKPLLPPPDSWASHPESETAIWLIKMDQGGHLVLPPVKAAQRMLYFFEGPKVKVDGDELGARHACRMGHQGEVSLEAIDGSVELLLLQSRPIGDPVVQYGPFVMNTREEIAQAFADYQSTQFGGWPWPRQDMVHGNKIERFAKYPDGKVEKP